MEQHLSDHPGQPPELPPECIAQHLVGHLLAVGPVLAGGMGPVPVCHQQLAAYQANVGIELTSWEAATLVHLSRVYLGAAQAARAADAPPPWLPDAPDTDHRQATATKVRNILGSRAGSAAPTTH